MANAFQGNAFQSNAFESGGGTTQEGSFSAASILRSTKTGNFSADAVIKKTISGASQTFTADAELFSATSGNFTADATLATVPTGNFTANAVLVATVRSGTSTSTYSSEVLADSPDFWFRLHETSGNFSDSSGNGKTGTVTGTPTYRVAGPLVGQTTYGITESGSQYITANYTVSSHVASSCEVWFKVSGSGFYRFSQNRNSGGKALQFGIGPGGFGSAAGQLNAYINSDGLWIGIHSVATYNDNKWHHAVATWATTSGQSIQTSHFKIYVDGAQVQTIADTVVGGWNSPLTGNGNMTLLDNSYSGSASEIAYYHTELSAARVLAHYRSGAEYGTILGPTANAIKKATVTGRAAIDIVLRDGPSAFWVFDKTDDGTVPELIAGKSGGYTPSPPTFNTGVFPNSSAATVSANIYAPTSHLLPSTNAVTIECWFKTTSTSAMRFTGMRDGSSVPIELGMGAFGFGSSAGQLVLFNNNNGVWVGKHTNSTYHDGNWHHVVAVWSGTGGQLINGNQMKFYVDGNLVAGTDEFYAAQYAPASGAQPTYLLAGRDGALLASGTYQAIAIYAKALTATQAAQHYAATTLPSGITMEAFIRLYFTADAVITDGSSTKYGNFTANAVIAKTQSGSLAADSISKRTQSGSLTADAIAKKTQAGSFTADAFILGWFTVDAWITDGSKAGSFAADAVIQKAVSGSASADAVIRKEFSSALTADAVLAKSASASFTADAEISSGTKTGNFTADADIFGTRTGSFTANAAKSVLRSGSFTVDATILAKIFSDDFNRTVALGLGSPWSWCKFDSNYSKSWDSIVSVDGSALAAGQASYDSYIGIPIPSTGELTFDFKVPVVYFYDTPAYGINFDFTNWGGVYVYAWDADSWGLGQWETDSRLVNLSLTSGNWYRVKARWTTTNMRIKIWQVGQSEPGSWNYDADLETGPGFPFLDLYYTPDAETGYLDNIEVWSSQSTWTFKSGFQADAWILGATKYTFNFPAESIIEYQGGQIFANAEIIPVRIFGNFTANAIIKKTHGRPENNWYNWNYEWTPAHPSWYFWYDNPFWSEPGIKGWGSYNGLANNAYPRKEIGVNNGWYPGDICIVSISYDRQARTDWTFTPPSNPYGTFEQIAHVTLPNDDHGLVVFAARNTSLSYLYNFASYSFSWSRSTSFTMSTVIIQNAEIAKVHTDYHSSSSLTHTISGTTELNNALIVGFLGTNRQRAGGINAGWLMSADIMQLTADDVSYASQATGAQWIEKASTAYEYTAEFRGVDGDAPDVLVWLELHPYGRHFYADAWIEHDPGTDVPNPTLDGWDWGDFFETRPFASDVYAWVNFYNQARRNLDYVMTVAYAIRGDAQSHPSTSPVVWNATACRPATGGYQVVYDQIWRDGDTPWSIDKDGVGLFSIVVTGRNWAVEFLDEGAQEDYTRFATAVYVPPYIKDYNTRDRALHIWYAGGYNWNWNRIVPVVTQYTNATTMTTPETQAQLGTIGFWTFWGDEFTNGGNTPYNWSVPSVLRYGDFFDAGTGAGTATVNPTTNAHYGTSGYMSLGNGVDELDMNLSNWGSTTGIFPEQSTSNSYDDATFDHGISALLLIRPWRQTFVANAVIRKSFEFSFTIDAEIDTGHFWANAIVHVPVEGAISADAEFVPKRFTADAFLWSDTGLLILDEQFDRRVIPPGWNGSADNYTWTSQNSDGFQAFDLGETSTGLAYAQSFSDPLAMDTVNTFGKKSAWPASVSIRNDPELPPAVANGLTYIIRPYDSLSPVELSASSDMGWWALPVQVMYSEVEFEIELENVLISNYGWYFFIRNVGLPAPRKPFDWSDSWMRSQRAGRLVVGASTIVPTPTIGVAPDGAESTTQWPSQLITSGREHGGTSTWRFRAQLTPDVCRVRWWRVDEQEPEGWSQVWNTAQSPLVDEWTTYEEALATSSPPMHGVISFGIVNANVQPSQQRITVNYIKIWRLQNSWGNIGRFRANAWIRKLTGTIKWAFTADAWFVRPPNWFVFDASAVIARGFYANAFIQTGSRFFVFDAVIRDPGRFVADAWLVNQVRYVPWYLLADAWIELAVENRSGSFSANAEIAWWFTADAFIDRGHFSADALIVPAITADAYIIDLSSPYRRGSFTGDAVVHARKDRSFAADALILVYISPSIYQKSFTANAVLSTGRFLCTLDAIKKRTYIKTTLSANALLVQPGRSSSFTADAVIFGGNLTADAWILGSIPGTRVWAFTGDAVINKSTTGSSFTAGAWIALHKSFLLVAVIAAPATRTNAFTADAVVEETPFVGTYTSGYSADAYIKGLFTEVGDTGDPTDPNGGIVVQAATRKFRVRILCGVVGQMDDITPTVLWEPTYFQQEARTGPGNFEVHVRGAYDPLPKINIDQAYKSEGLTDVEQPIEIWLEIDDIRQFGGYVLQVERGHFFEDYTAPRTILRGVDYNILFDRLTLYNTESSQTVAGRQGDYHPTVSWPKGMSDRDIIINAAQNWLDLPPDLDYQTYVDEITSPNPEAMGAALDGEYWRGYMQSITRMTSGLFWIDPYKNLHYHSRYKPTSSAYPLSDGVGGVSYRNLALELDISQMRTESMVWGTLASTTANRPIFARRRDETSISTYGLWQEADYNAVKTMHTQAHIDQRAESIIERYSKPIVRASLEIFEPGYMAGMVVSLTSSEFDFTANLIIKEISIRFALMYPAEGGTYFGVPIYSMSMGLDPEEPWTIYDPLPWPFLDIDLDTGGWGWEEPRVDWWLGTGFANLRTPCDDPASEKLIFVDVFDREDGVMTPPADGWSYNAPAWRIRDKSARGAGLFEIKGPTNFAHPPYSIVMLVNPRPKVEPSSFGEIVNLHVQLPYGSLTLNKNSQRVSWNWTENGVPHHSWTENIPWGPVMIRAWIDRDWRHFKIWPANRPEPAKYDFYYQKAYNLNVIGSTIQTNVWGSRADDYGFSPSVESDWNSCPSIEFVGICARGVSVGEWPLGVYPTIQGIGRVHGAIDWASGTAWGINYSVRDEYQESMGWYGPPNPYNGDISTWVNHFASVQVEYLLYEAEQYHSQDYEGCEHLNDHFSSYVSISIPRGTYWVKIRTTISVWQQLSQAGIGPSPYWEPVLPNAWDLDVYAESWQTFWSGEEYPNLDYGGLGTGAEKVGTRRLYFPAGESLNDKTYQEVEIMVPVYLDDDKVVFGMTLANNWWKKADAGAYGYWFWNVHTYRTVRAETWGPLEIWLWLAPDKSPEVDAPEWIYFGSFEPGSEDYGWGREVVIADEDAVIALSNTPTANTLSIHTLPPDGVRLDTDDWSWVDAKHVQLPASLAGQLVLATYRTLNYPKAVRGGSQTSSKQSRNQTYNPISRTEPKSF